MSRTTGRSIERAHIRVRGMVQGVGFRPYVYGLALKHSLEGWVRNTSEGVEIEVEGEAGAIERFEHELQAEAPPLARIEDLSVEYSRPAGYESFEIRPSRVLEGEYQLVSPDVATCPACLSELLNPADRRYRYPFINCTNCGPRFTIIEDMPYDRSRTTMRDFQMCPQCQAEYDDPLDRRFHAQPNACPRCGPRVELLDGRGNPLVEPDPLAAAAQALKQGRIVAVKGLGGFLLACDATNDKAVRTLRQRKKRVSKPLAVMITTAEEARRHCHVSPEEEELLSSPQSPIVLMLRRKNSAISREVAPGLQYMGIMLPYTPLHHVLLREAGVPLVMTSGNLSEEPIATDNSEALGRLSAIADCFLVHNRGIYSGYDDSVAMVEGGASRMIRRARGYAPFPVRLPFDMGHVLGCGAEEKNTFCLTKDSYAFLSQHIGDMENLETLEHFRDTLSLYKRVFRIEPEVVAHDLHPDYLATRYAQELGRSGMRMVPVQHHHAHIASCMADNGLESPVIGVAFDGTGMGADGNIWGGEFLLADYREFRRAGSLQYLPLPGGAAAIKRPYRIAIGYILTLLGVNALGDVMAILDGAKGQRSRQACLGRGAAGEVDVIKHQIEARLNTPLSSSMGRLFDAVSALVGIRGEIDYEAQAAVELEMAAWEQGHTQDCESYPYRIVDDAGARIVLLGDLLAAILQDLHHGLPNGRISLRFHNTVARMVGEMCRLIADETGVRQVALTGGVFQNRLLWRKTVNALESSGLEVFSHRRVPCNDGGISLGQAVIAAKTET